MIGVLDIHYDFLKDKGNKSCIEALLKLPSKIPNQSLKKKKKPSRPEAMSPFGALTTSKISLSSKDLSNHETSSTPIELKERLSNFGSKPNCFE
jgi:hypothetical protein